MRTGAVAAQFSQAPLFADSLDQRPYSVIVKLKDDDFLKIFLLAPRTASRYNVPSESLRRHNGLRTGTHSVSPAALP